MAKRTSTRRSVRRRRSAPRRTAYRRPVRRYRRTTYKSKCVCPPQRILPPSTKFALAQLDPFDPKVFGAKVPDSNTIPSIANQDIDILAIPTTAGQLAGRAYRPRYTFGEVVPTYAASNLVWDPAYGGGQNRQKRTQLGSVAEVIRPVAHAVRLSCPLASTSATGFVHIGLSVESNLGVTTWQYPTTVAEMANLAHYKRITLASLTQTPITAINKWVDDSGFMYRAVASRDGAETANNIEIQTEVGWAAIIVMIEGAPASSAALSVEHCLLSEFIPDKNSVIIGTAAAPSEPAVMSATATMMGEQEFTHVEAEQESYIQQGVSNFAAGLTQAGAGLVQQYAMPAMQAAGRLAGHTAGRFAINALLGLGGIAGVNSNPNRLALGN